MIFLIYKITNGGLKMKFVRTPKNVKKYELDTFACNALNEMRMDLSSVAPMVTENPKVQKLQKPFIEDKYKELLDSFDHEEHYVNRDGDLFRVICPECGSKNHHYISGGFFVCARRHLFHVYTEDGVSKKSALSEDSLKRVLGDDLGKDGMDSHGHEKYIYIPKDAKVNVYFEFYKGWDTDDSESTFEKVNQELVYLEESLRNFADKFERFYLPHLYFYTEFNSALKGVPSSDVISWPEAMWIQKVILLKLELENINKKYTQDTSRGFRLILVSNE